MESKIKNAMRRFNFQGRSASLQFWEYIQVDHNKWQRLGVVDHLFVSTQDKKGLENYRERCNRNNDDLVGPVIQVDQEGVAAYQRTSHDPDQILGQLFVPVVYYQGAGEIFAGFIELATIRPKRSYDAEFNQLQNLLMGENLATKPLDMTI